jgi:hypothetical protein
MNNYEQENHELLAVPRRSSSHAPVKETLPARQRPAQRERGAFCLLMVGQLRLNSISTSQYCELGRSDRGAQRRNQWKTSAAWTQVKWTAW